MVGLFCFENSQTNILPKGAYCIYTQLGIEDQKRNRLGWRLAKALSELLTTPFYFFEFVIQ